MKTKIANPDVQERMHMSEIYAERMTEPRGMLTGIDQVDRLICGMERGTLTTIAGYSSHYTTMFGVNIAYRNAYTFGYNIAYISLQSSKESMYAKYLCRHSYDMKFSKYYYIPHDRIYKCTLSKDEQDYLQNVIEPDLYSDYTKDDDGEMYIRGSTTFYDLCDFETFRFDEIKDTLEALDDKLNGTLDAVIIDTIQDCRFLDSSTSVYNNNATNLYAELFRRLAQDFRTGEKNKKLTVILLSQISRESYKPPSRNKKMCNDGAYDLKQLASSKLEFASDYIITTYASEDMKLCCQAQVQLLKSRTSMLMVEPLQVFAKPEAYVYSDDYDLVEQPCTAISDALALLDDVIL